MRRNVIHYVMREGLSFRRKKGPLVLSQRKPVMKRVFSKISNAHQRMQETKIVIFIRWILRGDFRLRRLAQIPLRHPGNGQQQP